MLHTPGWRTLVAGDCLQQRSGGQARLNTRGSPHRERRAASVELHRLSGPGEPGILQLFEVKDAARVARLAPASVADQVELTPLQRRVGSKCILLVDVQEGNRTMSSSITVFPDTNAGVQKAVTYLREITEPTRRCAASRGELRRRPPAGFPPERVVNVQINVQSVDEELSVSRVYADGLGESLKEQAQRFLVECQSP
ncbi:hypothetical protein EYF80_045847 [Liparis tanakae]|uniref:Uncharacterized protein n=1 Tax=Liparis tanakae TaxID=230148 RepID=A0A4Z2FUD1_9TELE|nr:hypothetical protein EYF80_045847 [Liparis tanakae]